MSMGHRSMTSKAWKAQGCFASEIQFLGRKLKRKAKKQNSRALRIQSKKQCRAATDG